MQVCKKLTLVPVFALALSVFLWGQSETSTTEKKLIMPQFPSVTAPKTPAAPSMPSVSNNSSTSLNNFYVPGFQNSASTNGSTGSGSANSGGTTAGSESASLTTDALNAGSSLTSDSSKTLAESLAKNRLLTAGDISSLYDSGLFGSVSSISNASDSKTTEILLQKILTSLEELKTTQEGASPDKKQELSNYQHDSKLFKSREPKILRFKINGYNIADSISTSFFSEAEADGSFLFTGDRTYYVSGRERNETFYILFKAIRSNGSAVTFEVTPSLVQDFENPNSFVYRFCQKKDLRAEKTGNLVSLHFSEADLNVDLLLDIDIER